MNTFRFVQFLAFFALIGFTTACLDKAEKKAAADEVKEKKDERVPVEIRAIARGPIEATVVSSANLEAEEQVKIFSRASNHVVELLVEEGDRVEKGQVLLRLENKNQKVQLMKAEAQLGKARREHERYKDLYEKEMASQQDFNNITYDLRQAEYNFEDAKREMAYTEITAPITGTITSRLVNLGDFVNVNQHLFDLIDFDSIVARVYLPERNLKRLQLNQDARITSQAHGDKVFGGFVKRISPVVDARTGTVKVTVSLDQGGPLRPGMYVDVALILETRNDALLLPKQALVYDNDQIFVFRIKRNDGKAFAERVPVNPRLIDTDFVEPAGGFSDGDEIVMAGQTGLKDDAEVRILDGGQKQAPGAQADQSDIDAKDDSETEVALK